MLARRLREVYGEDVRAKASWLFRPAIEEHKQNHEWGGADNRFVEGMRDALIAWVDRYIASVMPYMESLLSDEAEIVRRIALHVMNEKWDVLRPLLSKSLRPNLFDSGHLHELYGLLHARFGSFTAEEKTSTLNAIRQMQPSDNWKEPDLNLKRVQRNWLSAIVGKGSADADMWYSTLEADETLGRLSDHPDFHTYMESSWGPGPAPFRAEQLVEFAKQGKLIEQLNAFVPTRSWRAPTTRALVDALEEAIAIAPAIFVEAMPTFIKALRPYQYGLVNGFKQLWDASRDRGQDVSWPHAWPALMSFFENLLGDENFWTESVVENRDLTPTRDWIPSIIAEFLRAGTRDDEKSYDPDLLLRGWHLIRIILDKAELAEDVDRDAMTQAINTEKGKAVEALFSHALRTCRVADRSRNTHADEWTLMKSVFDAEVLKCRGTNFEFSTLAGAYLANIEYLNAEWLRVNFDAIFPTDFPDNFFCAVAGLAYTPVARSIYQLLASHGVLDRALNIDLRERSVRERLVERIALAFLWGDEQLTSPRFTRIFNEHRFDDLQVMADFFWSVSNQELKPGQVRKILDFWSACTERTQDPPTTPVQFLSHLSRLSVYLVNVGEKETGLLSHVAPHVSAGYNSDYFVEQLLRLVEANPAAISAVFAKMLETHEPTFDYQDRLKTLVRKLGRMGQRAALVFADCLRQVPGMREVYAELIQ